MVRAAREGERKRRKEGKRRGVGLEGGRGCLNGQMDCSFSTHVEPCFVFHCRQAGAESVALLARATFVLHTSLFSTAHTHTDTHASVCTHSEMQVHTQNTCTHATQTSPSFSAHMLKSSPLLSASKTQHPRLLCCCQVLPLADATGESYPSEVGLPRERQAPRYIQPPLM